MKGATRSQRAFAACSNGQKDQLLDILLRFDTKAQRIQFLNTAKDSLGQYCLHRAVKSGDENIVDFLTNRRGLEVDDVDTIYGDTAIHKAIRYVNDNQASEEKAAEGMRIVTILTDAGVDLKKKNKDGQKPIDLVDPRNEELRLILLKEQYKRAEGEGVVDAESEGEEEEDMADDNDEDSLLDEKFSDGYVREPSSEGE